jgi:hypothetical protein
VQIEHRYLPQLERVPDLTHLPPQLLLVEQCLPYCQVFDSFFFRYLIKSLVVINKTRMQTCMRARDIIKDGVIRNIE